MVQHILARFTYCNEKFCALFFRFFFVFFFRKVLECDSMRFLHPSQVKTLSFAYSRGFKFQVFLRKREKKNEKKIKKKIEKSTKSTYTIVSAICDCPPEVRRKRSMRTELYRRALICVWIARMRSRWWYALLQSMRAEPTYTK